MWTSSQFDQYLKKVRKASNGEFDIFETMIVPQLKKGCIASILATRDSVVQNEPLLSHEVFGYDFMVDTSFNVWLIEVNSSPSMEYSSPITERMVKEVLPNLAEVVKEQEVWLTQKKDWDLGVGARIGKFELIYNN